MKILIVGSCGFIGSNAVSYFIKKNFQVYGCDVVSSAENDIPFIKVEKDSDYRFIFKYQKFDVCINASGSGTVGFSYQQTYYDFELNCANVYKILDAIRLYNPACKFINLSSAAVYGNPKYLPVSEKDPLDPISPYAYHKLMSEIICKEYYELFGLRTCALRIFSVYGPGLRKQLLWDIYKKSLEKDDIELSGTGKESRDFIYLDDLYYAMECVVEKADFSGECVNVGTGIETTIGEVANEFIRNFDGEKTVRFSNSFKAGDPLNWCADISLLKSYGFNPKISLKQGLINYSEWLKKQ